MSKWKASRFSIAVIVGCIWAFAYSISQSLNAYNILRVAVFEYSNSFWTITAVMLGAMQLFIILAGSYAIKESIRTLWRIWKCQD